MHQNYFQSPYMPLNERIINQLLLQAFVQGNHVFSTLLWKSESQAILNSFLSYATPMSKLVLTPRYCTS